MKRNKRILLILFVLLFLTGIIFIGKTEKHRLTEVDTQNTENTEDTIAVISEYSVPYTLDELIEQSNLVIRGTVESISDPFLIKGVNNIGELSYTDYDITVSEVLRGNLPSDSSSVVVRMEGDPSDKTVIYESSPILDNGTEYLLFLQKPGIGGGFNTEGDYYYILGLRQGVYENMTQESHVLSAERADEVFVSQEKIFTMKKPEKGIPQIYRQEIDIDKILEENETDKSVLTLNQFSKKIFAAETDHPVNENLRREEIENNYKTNLETGMLTKEEYNQLMNELDQYAEIIKATPHKDCA